MGHPKVPFNFAYHFARIYLLIKKESDQKVPDPISWTIIIICIFGHFLFSLSETALACSNRFKMQVEADEGKKVSKLVVKLCKKYDRTLTAILVGNNVAAIVISTISTLLFYNYLSSYHLEEYASIISSIIFTFVVYIVGDTLPKTIARAIPDTTSKLVAYPIYIISILLTPISIIFELMVTFFEKVFKRKNDEVFTSDDLEKVLELSEEMGNFDEENLEIIQSAIEFADTTVKEVFTTRRKIFALDISSLTLEGLKEAITNTSYSRIPIYENDLDNYLGVLVVKSFIKEYLNNPSINIKDILQSPYVVSSRINLVDLLNGFKEHHTHLAMVVNKDNHIIGMVTMEDVLEELVDDISEPKYVKEEE